MALFTSGNNIVSTKYFLLNYYGISYDKKKLSHDGMMDILISKGKKIPSSICFDNVDELQIACGNVILVKGAEGKVIAYRNPMMSLKELELELKENKESLREIRKQILLEQGLYLQEDDSILTKEECEMDKEYETVVDFRFQKVMKRRKQSIYARRG